MIRNIGSIALTCTLTAGLVPDVFADGKADIIVLDRDIYRQAEENIYDLHKTQVMRTYLNGKLVYLEGGLPDEELDDELPNKRTSVF